MRFIFLVFVLLVRIIPEIPAYEYGFGVTGIRYAMTGDNQALGTADLEFGIGRLRLSAKLAPGERLPEPGFQYLQTPMMTLGLLDPSGLYAGILGTTERSILGIHGPPLKPGTARRGGPVDLCLRLSPSFSRFGITPFAFFDASTGPGVGLTARIAPWVVIEFVTVLSAASPRARSEWCYDLPADHSGRFTNSGLSLDLGFGSLGLTLAGYASAGSRIPTRCGFAAAAILSTGPVDAELEVAFRQPGFVMPNGRETRRGFSGRTRIELEAGSHTFTFVHTLGIDQPPPVPGSYIPSTEELGCGVSGPLLRAPSFGIEYALDLELLIDSDSQLGTMITSRAEAEVVFESRRLEIAASTRLGTDGLLEILARYSGLPAPVWFPREPGIRTLAGMPVEASARVELDLGSPETELRLVAAVDLDVVETRARLELVTGVGGSQLSCSLDLGLAGGGCIVEGIECVQTGSARR